MIAAFGFRSSFRKVSHFFRSLAISKGQMTLAMPSTIPSLLPCLQTKVPPSSICMSHARSSKQTHSISIVGLGRKQSNSVMYQPYLIGLFCEIIYNLLLYPSYSHNTLAKGNINRRKRWKTHCDCTLFSKSWKQTVNKKVRLLFCLLF